MEGAKKAMFGDGDGHGRSDWGRDMYGDDEDDYEPSEEEEDEW